MKNKRRECKRAAAMLLAALMVVNSVDLSAFTAYAAQAELVPEKTEQSASSKECVMTITDFEELEEDVMQQLLPVGASEEEIIFPDTLNVTVSVSDTQEEKDTTDNEEEVSEGESESKETVSGNAVSETPKPEGEESDVTGSKSETEQTPETEGETEKETGEHESETPEPEGEESNTTDIDNTETASIFQTVLSAFAPMTVYAAEEKGANDGEEAVQTKNVTLTGVTWEIEPSESDGEVFDSCEDCDGYCYVYTPVLPETDEDGNKVTLGDNVELPVIYVLIGEGEEHVSAIAEDGYDDEGFCKEYSWVDGEIKADAGEGARKCIHGDDCNGYQPATLETLNCDFNGDGNTDENDKAYKITNAGQLYWFAAYVNRGDENLNANAYLANDITINENLLNRIETDDSGNVTNDNGARKWVPIGDYASSNTLIYKGVFNGNNHSIKGIYIYEIAMQRMGIFGWQQGKIENLSVEDSKIIAQSYVGGIIGVNGGAVKNCSFKGEVCAVQQEINDGYMSAVGGICGASVKNAQCISCTNEGEVIGYLDRIGGICGSSIGVIEDCTNRGHILSHYAASTENHGAIGGIVGYNGVSNSGARGMVKGCVNYGKIEGDKTADQADFSVGGIVGENNAGSINGCSNYGTIDGNGNKGGICSWNRKNSESTFVSEIANCSNLVDDANVGLCYYNEASGKLIKCFTITSKVCYGMDKADNTAVFDKVFYISETETDEIDGTTAMTVADFASGKVAYLLNQGQESAVWYQNIDNSGTKDTYPVLDSTHGKVYQCQGCTGVYSNTENKTAEHVLIQNVNDTTKHICKNCGESNMAHSASSFTEDGNKITGTCVCGAECGTFTLNAPTSLTYDGTAKEATVSGTITGVTGTPTISYFKVVNGIETSLTGKPKDVGTYKASISCGEGNGKATAAVTYEITQATPTVEWSDTSETTVSYTGNPISSDKLPALTVKGVGGNAVTGYTADDFTYSYRALNSDREFTEGLPTNLGDYEIKATVEAKGNYTGTETIEDNYLTLKFGWLDTTATATLTDQNDNLLTGDDWWAQSVTFTAPSGFTISRELNGSYDSSFLYDAETGISGTEITYYLKNSNGEIAQITQTVRIDHIAPTFPDEGNYGIKIKDNWFKSLLNTITFNLLYKENVDVTVKAEDALSGIAYYYYWEDTSGSTTVLTAEELSAKTFTKTDNAKIATTTQDGKYVYYVYVEDKAGNRSNYICSEGVVVDTAAPEVSVTTGTKDVTATLTVTATDTGSGLEGNYHLYYSTNSLDGMTAEQIIGDSSTQSNATGEFPLTGLDCATTYHYAVVVKDRAGNVALKKDTFTTEKTIPEFDASYIPTISGVYGQSLFDMTLSKTTDTSKNGITGIWEVTEANAGSIYPTVNGTKKYEVTFTPTDGSKFATYNAQITPSVTPKELRVSAVSAVDRPFEPNNNKVSIWVNLSGIKDGDTVEVANAYSLQGTVGSPDAGRYYKVILPTLTLTGEDSDNYTLKQTSGEVALTSAVVISKVAYHGDRSVSKQYLYSKLYENETIQLSDYLPEGCGMVTYGELWCTPTGGIVSGCSRIGNELCYKVNQADTSGGSATIEVTVEPKNYEQYMITIEIQHIDKYPVILKPNTSVTLKDSNLTYGQPLSELEFQDAVFVSRDNPNQTVSGTLAWTNPDTKPNAGTPSAEWTFTPDNSDYATVTGYASITVSKATAVYTPPTVEGVVNYHPEHTLLGIDLMNGAVTGVDGSPLQGRWSWENEEQVPQVNNSGYTAKFEAYTPEYDTNYNPIACTVTVTVAKATPYIDADTLTAEKITYGQTLADSSVQGRVYYDSTKQTLVEGSFVWKDRSIKPTAKDDSNNTRYTVIFKPTDSANYNEVETEITITVNKAENAPNMPGSTMSVQNSITKVGDVTLPQYWVWQESDKDTPLEVEVAQSATALYEGADKGNYEKESVEIMITRSACDHVPGEILYTGTGEHAPDCVNDGLGHKECTKCHAVTESGIVVAALGHQGGTATCKKKAVCTVCHQEYGSTNPNNHAATEVREHKNADCTSAGYTGDTHCADCGTKLKSGTTIAALGHDYKSEVTTEPTTTSTGVRTYTCERCGYSYTETIAKLPEEEETTKPSVSHNAGKTYRDDKGKAAYTIRNTKKKTVTYTAPADKNVTTVTIPATIKIDGITYRVTSIAKKAFQGSKKLTKVTIGSNVLSIGEKAFYGCKKLKTVTIGKKVKVVGKKAFYGCKSLKTLTVQSTKFTAKNVGSKAWSKTSKKLTVKVPKKKYKAYKQLLTKKGISKTAKFQKK